MSDTNPLGQAEEADFLKIWAESFSKLSQAAFSFSPDSAPPEMLRQVRSGIFQALTHSWDEFLRSPQFMRSMKEMMDNAIAFRNMSRGFLNKARQDFGSIGQEDFDALVLAVRQVEARMAERSNDLSAQLAALNHRLTSMENTLRLADRAPVSRRKTPRRRRAPHKT